MYPNQTTAKSTKKRVIGGLPLPVPNDRRCQAKNRQGERCGRWAVKGKRVCRNHGGLSRGPKTKLGRQRIAEAQTKHGRYSLDTLKARMLKRLKKAYVEQGVGVRLVKAEKRRYDPHLMSDPSLYMFGYLEKYLVAINYKVFREKRKCFASFCRGDITFEKLARVLDGKDYSQQADALQLKHGPDHIKTRKARLLCLIEDLGWAVGMDGLHEADRVEQTIRHMKIRPFQRYCKELLPTIWKSRATILEYRKRKKENS